MTANVAATHTQRACVKGYQMVIVPVSSRSPLLSIVKELASCMFLSVRIIKSKTEGYPNYQEPVSSIGEQIIL